MKKFLIVAGAIVALAAPAAALADPASPDNGCTGYWTTQYKDSVGDRSAQGLAIGGLGNSDGNSANGQAHSDLGRGEMMKEFHAQYCGK